MGKLSQLKKEFHQSKTFISFMLFKTLGQGFLFIVPMALAALFTPETFGKYALGMMVVYFFATFIVRSSHTSFIVYGSEELTKTHKLNKTVTARMKLMGIFTLIFFVLITIFFNPIIQFTALSQKEFIFLLLALVGIGVKFSIEGFFLALDKKITSAFYDFIFGLMILIYIGVLFYFFEINLSRVFFAFLLSAVLATAFLIKKKDIKKTLPLKLEREVYKKVAIFTQWTMITGLSIYLISWGDNLILRFFVGLDQIGVYNLGYHFFKGLTIVFAFISTYFLPAISRQLSQKNKMNNYLYNKRLKILTVGFLGLIVLFFVIPLFIDLVYGKDFQKAIPVFKILLFGSFFSLYWSFYHPIFVAMKKYKFISFSILISAAFNLGMDYLLVRQFGILGAAYATTITYILMTALYEFYFQIFCKTKLVG